MSAHRRSNRFSLTNPTILDLRSSLVESEANKQSLLSNHKTKKILIMGYNETGKSSITLKFLYNFPDASNLGPEENYYTSIKYPSALLSSSFPLRYKKESFLLHLVDFAGIVTFYSSWADFLIISRTIIARFTLISTA